MIMYEYVDKYNPHKIWLIKVYKMGMYTCNQYIKGKFIYKRYQRTTKKRLKEIGFFK